MAIGDFREQALRNTYREQSNAARLLARHYDSELGQLTAIQQNIVELIAQSDFASSAHFNGQMSSLAMHEVLRNKLAAAGDGVAIFAASGALLNSADIWPVPDVTIADRAYFQLLKSGSLNIVNL
ncbi:hypothetical protein [Rhodopseudomonas sp. BAL398]|uniref:hypothetical protein n=1 Tax=Rhodopseudomonas sp. BAL398 TaxID=3034676 RepID=UPI00294B90C7|nr:hypothetical protein [Rhodopseudomonas sp. BAL398]WOK17026.1 hypothetical protein RBJ75_23305 [Rhodopseudomonas sp. BAL398]